MSGLRTRSARRPRRRTLDRNEIDRFDHVAAGLLDRVRLIRTNLLPPQADGLTIGRFIFLRGNRIEHRATTLLAHELVHVRQFAELGPIRFFSIYLREYFTHLWRLRNHYQAYLAISLEVEAREVAAQWQDRTSNAEG